MKKYLWFILLPVFVLFTYLLWPLSSDTWNIDHEASSIKFKNSYLNQAEGTPESDRPNILIIMADDLGIKDISLNGNTYINTPNIDQLAKEGVHFTEAYVASPVCSPSRAAMITGRYPQRYGFQYQMHDRYLKNRLEYFVFKNFVDSHPWHPVWMNEVPDQKAILKQGLPPGEILLSEVLKKQGYATGLVGKWHMGWDESNIPCQFGFDYHYGFYASHTLFAPEGSEGIVDHKVHKDFTDKHIWKGQRNGPHAIYRNCVKIDEKGYLTDRIAEEAIGFISNHKDDTFFLWVSFNAPHTPLQAKAEYYNKLKHIEDPIKRTYYAMILSLDEGVGNIMNALKKLDLEKNTLVFFLSDNGGAEYTYTTDNGPYKGGKITDFEGGIKVPMILKWAGHIPENITYDEPVISMDIFATSVEIANANLPTDRVYDGVNLLPYLHGSISGRPHEYLFWQRGFSKAIRSKEWKLLLNEDALDTALFHLSKDPYESVLVDRANKKVVHELLDAHQKWSEPLPDPLWPSMVYYLFKDNDKDYYFDQ